MNAQERFDDLVSTYLDEALDAEGMAELNTLLATRPDYAARFVRLSRLHAGLRELSGPGSLAVRPSRRLLVWISSVAAALLLLGISLAIVRSGPARPGKKGVLLIVGKADPLTPGDLAVQAHLEARGFAVTPVVDLQADAERAKGMAFVFISESTLSSELGGRFTKLAVPLLNCEPNLNGSLRLTGPPVPNRKYAKHPQRILRIVDPSHPLAAGLKGFVPVYGEGDSWMGWGEPEPGAARIATTDGTDREVCLFAYEAGSRVREETLPARRLFFFMPNNSQEATRLNEAGWKLFDAAVDWLLAK